MKWIDIRESGKSYDNAIRDTHNITSSYRLLTLLEYKADDILWCVMDPKRNKWRNTF